MLDMQLLHVLWVGMRQTEVSLIHPLGLLLLLLIIAAIVQIPFSYDGSFGGELALWQIVTRNRDMLFMHCWLWAKVGKYKGLEFCLEKRICFSYSLPRTKSDYLANITSTRYGGGHVLASSKVIAWLGPGQDTDARANSLKDNLHYPILNWIDLIYWWYTFRNNTGHRILQMGFLGYQGYSHKR